MEMYLTEEERVEALKRWWKENASAVFLGIGLGIAALSGWNLWEKNQNQKAEQASLLYQKLMQTQAEADPGKNANAEAATRLAEDIVKTAPDSLYGTYAQLYLIHREVENQKLAAAHQKLDALLAKTQDPQLKTLVSVRLARVMHGEGKTADALNLLEKLNAGRLQTGWTSLVSELKGDLLYAQGQKDAARTAYEQAKRATDAASPLLLQKLANLGIAQPSP